ncbi:anti-sigma factor family protein [Streptomyces sp. NPDC090994]|uniref:anti-sigma factor family protein n=1 Tax=Streptomyces sp. NPDC090994 TaxID=3365969 RepID=UPI0037FB004C
MSGSRPKSEGHLAEQHLGDRLSALVDGELGHDARERVLAHVATCPKCKAEVDAQRRLKNVFAEASGPAPSESLLARLQGLPGGDGSSGSSPGGDALSGFSDLTGRFGTTGAFGVERGGGFAFGYAPSRSHASSVLAPSAPGRGFRIHDVGRHESDRAASRGLRFAFVAAGAVSLAAVALGGVTAGFPDSTTEARGGSGTGSNVTPARTQGAGSSTTPETQRRRLIGPLLGQAAGQGSPGDAPVASTALSAPLLPGLPAPSAGPDDQTGHPLTTPVMAGAVAMSPLIRPFEAVVPVALSAWPTTPEVTAPGLLSAPVPDPYASPSTAPSASPAASSFPSAP